jgi:hypothetical protein
MRMPSSNNLCENCSKIPFEPGLATLRASNYKGSTAWKLGPFGQVRKRHCPFCILVTSICTKVVASWYTKSQLEDDEEVEVEWSRGGFHAKRHSQIGSYVCMVTTENTTDVLGARDQFDEQIDLKEAKRWMHNCMKKHDFADCSKREQRTLNFKDHRFRLIDVKADCIVPAELSHAYATLSYIWGDPIDGRLLLQVENATDLGLVGSLKKRWKTIPLTIRDAMAAVKGLGQQFLWVDSLCIIQDDSTELHESCMLMDRVYQEAEFTLVAASGDANHGLPGVSSTKRNPSRLARDICPGLRMTTIHDLDSWLRTSKYSQRGWT